VCIGEEHVQHARCGGPSPASFAAAQDQMCRPLELEKKFYFLKSIYSLFFYWRLFFTLLLENSINFIRKKNKFNVLQI
jgi:hypothetical protein